MAPTLVQFVALRSNVKCIKCWKLRQVLTVGEKFFSTQYLRPYSTRRKFPLVAFMIGFGLAGFVGLAGLFVGRRKQKHVDAAPLSETKTPHHSFWTLQSAIDESRSIIKCMKEQTGSPGVSVAVSVDGKLVWSEGFGFADVENRVLCSGRTVMRIASISKPLAATAVAKLWEEEQLDLDAPIQSYVPSFPEKTFNGSTVTLTTRHLLSHLAGVRHYDKSLCEKGAQEPREEKSKDDSKQETKLRDATSASKQKPEKKTDVTYCMMNPDSEYYIKDHYKTVKEALTLFKDDPLISAPGASYLYSTHGWTILSSVVESVTRQEFLLYMKNLFKDLGMDNTCAEFNDKIIPHRARFYQRDKKGRLVNAPYVDNSYKWAGGGFMSTAEDLVQFGNAMLYAKQANSCLDGMAAPEARHLPGILRPETVAELWKIAVNTEGEGHKRGGYGMGWAVIPEKHKFGGCPYQRETVLHGGCAIGASSILLIRPQVFNPATHAQISAHDSPIPPQGIVVAILVNLQSVSLETTAATVATLFEKMKH